MFFSLSLDPVVEWLNTLNPELVWIMMLFICFASMLILLKFFGSAGLYLYIGVAVVAANIQVLKATQFSFLPEPVALGTLLFTSIYLATDILTEYYSPAEGRKGVMLGFAAMALMTIFMTLGLGMKPPGVGEVSEGLRWASENHDHMKALFTPSFTLLVAGMAAYLISQFHDVWSFNFLKQATEGKHLWLRNNVSTLISALIDNTVFSILAWVVLAKDPLPWNVVIYTYILGTYGLRVVVALLDTPFAYLARYCLPAQDRENYENTRSYY